jgi:Flp pilus assembly protein TadG
MRRQSFNSLQSQSPERNGAVAVEMAVVLPVLLLLIFGIIESCNLIFLKQALTVAAYEGVRASIADGTTDFDVNERADQILNDRNVKSSTLTISPTNFTAAPYGSYIAVEVSAPYATNSIIPGWFFGSITLKSKVRMMKEY